MRLGKAVDAYLAARRADLAKTSRAVYRYTLENLTETIGADHEVGSLKRRHIERWLTLRAETNCPNSLRHEYSRVRGFTSWLVDSRLIRHDPCAGIRIPKVPVAIPREIRDPTAIQKLLNALPDTRAEVIVLLMVMEGLRRAEVAGLQIADLDLHEHLALIRGKGSKERFVPLHGDTIDAIERYLAESPTRAGPLVRNQMYPGPLSPGRIGALVAQWMRDAGIKQRGGDGKSAHALRHTSLGALLDAGADIREVQAIAGHASLGATYVYLRRRQASGQLLAAMQKRPSYRI